MGWGHERMVDSCTIASSKRVSCKGQGPAPSNSRTLAYTCTCTTSAFMHLMIAPLYLSLTANSYRAPRARSRTGARLHRTTAPSTLVPGHRPREGWEQDSFTDGSKITGDTSTYAQGTDLGRLPAQSTGISFQRAAAIGSCVRALLFGIQEIYSRELPLGSQSHSRISSLFVCASVSFVYKPSVKP